MPTYKGNRGNLLQHWVLTELTLLLTRQFDVSTTELSLVDAHAMSPYATRQANSGQTWRDFDTVRSRLPGVGSPYESAWAELINTPGVEYPTSAMFVSHLWSGPHRMVLCEIDPQTADDISRWSLTLPETSQVEVSRQDWRKRLRSDLPRSAACIVSFDPYMILSENAPNPTPGNMYLADIVKVAASIIDLQAGTLIVQMSTYNAQGHPQETVVPIVQWLMAAVGLELLDVVKADGHMMSIVLGRNLVRRPEGLHDRFVGWLANATKAA